MDELDLILFITNLSLIVLVGVLMMATPNIIRKSLLFGIRVPTSAHNEAEVKAIKIKYRVLIIVYFAVVLGIAVAQYVIAPDLSLMATLYFPFFALIAAFLAYYPCYKGAKSLKESKGWKVDSSSMTETRSAVARQKLKDIPWIWYIVGIVATVAMVIYAFYKYPSIPDVIPTHWNAQMEADAWGNKSYLLLMTFPLINLAMLLTMLFSNVAVLKMKLQVNTEDAALSFAQHRLYRRLMGHMLGFYTLLMTGFCAFMVPTSFGINIMDGSSFWIIFVILMAGFILPIIPLYTHVGQGGCKLKPKVTNADRYAAGHPMAQPSMSRGDDRFWILGMFYYNPEDPAILVEDRFGSNGGLNYARLPGKILAIALGMLIVVTYVICTVIFY